MNQRHFIFLLAGLTLLVSGCSSKFAYNNLDWMLYWYIDDFIELDKNQKQQLDVKIDSWHAWHRTNELRVYRQHLEDLKAQVKTADLNTAQWLLHFDRGRSHWQRIRDQIIPELSVMAIQLSDQQIVTLFDKLEKDNQEAIEERNEDTLEERITNSKTRTKKQIQEWTGKLSKHQIAIINDYQDQYQSTFEAWIEYRRTMQSEFKQLMLSRHKIDSFQTKFTNLLSDPDRYRSADYLRANQHNRNVFASMLAEIMPTLTNKQQKKVINEIDDLIDDIDDLIED